MSNHNLSERALADFNKQADDYFEKTVFTYKVCKIRSSIRTFQE